LHVFQVICLTLEFLHTENVALDFMVDDLHSGVTDLVGAEDLMELCEVGVGLKDIQEVQCQVD
jgi:hypothetical protein